MTIFAKAARAAILACALAAPFAAHAAEGGDWAREALQAGKTALEAERGLGRGRRGPAAGRSRLGGPRTEPQRLSGSLSGGITWHANSGCVPGQLRGVLSDLVGSFGPVTVTSTCRGVAQNRAAGGAGQSYHLRGQAVDFRVHGSTGAVYAYLASNGSVGGLKHYGGGLFHIDTGPRRSW